MTIDYDFGEYGYEYDVDWEEIQEAMKFILSDKTEDELKDIILEHFGEEINEDTFEDELTEYFKSDAEDAYRDSRSDEYGRRGVSQRDFY